MCYDVKTLDDVIFDTSNVKTLDDVIFDTSDVKTLDDVIFDNNYDVKTLDDVIFDDVKDFNVSIFDVSFLKMTILVMGISGVLFLFGLLLKYYK